MIELRNLTKIYKSECKEDIIANNNISLTFANKGIVFIVGKSGSGKTTLLNILGGLDKKTSGEYLVNGKPLESYKSLDEFRNKSVGFIFQDYNLIENLNVEENLQLVLSLQHEKYNKEKINQILKEVDLENYHKRKINELSGGQKQRVAIARALVKKSQFILADEPTGNLDSQTSIEIFNILKKISKTKLVIVVSHDNELAQKYADRIIEIKDGKIFNDLTRKEIKAFIENKKEVKTNPLSFNYIMKMVFNNIKSHSGKSIVSILLFVLTIFSMCVGEVFYNFNAENSIIKTYNDINSNYYLSQSIYSEINTEDYQAISYDSYSRINEAIYTKVLDGNSSYIRGYNISFNNNINSMYNFNSFYVIESKKDLDNLNLKFYKANQISNDGIYLTDYLIDFLLTDDYILSQNVDSYEKMVGLNVLKFDSYSNDYIFKYKIDGIIKTDYKNYFNKDFSIKEEFDKTYFKTKENYLNYVCQKKDFEYIPCYFNIEYLNNNYELDRIDFFENTFIKNKISLNQININTENLSLIDNKSYGFELIYNNKIYNSNEIELKQDEIFVNLYLYNELFDEIKYTDITKCITYNTEGEKVCSYNFKHLNEKINFSVNQLSLNKDIFNLNNKKIVGIIIKDYELSKNDGYEIYLNTNTINNCTILKHYNNLIRFRAFNKNDFDNIIINSRNLYNIGLNALDVKSIYSLEQTTKLISFIFLILSIILIVISILVSISVISLSINSRKKEIGILRALGTKNIDIEKIFIAENLFISICSFVISIILTYIGITIINSILIQNLINKVTLIYVSIFSWVIAFCISFILNLIACIFPLKVINKMNPIDSIKSL